MTRTAPIASHTVTGDASPSSDRFDVLEPFGQTGVRQFLVPIFSWVSLVCFSISIAMWYRSSTLSDQLLMREGPTVLSVESIAGRLKVELRESRLKTGNSPLSYRTRLVGGHVVDGWNESIFKTVGIEFSTTSVDPSGRGGMWLRIKWYFAAAVFAVLPLTRCLLKWRRDRTAE